MNIVVDKKDITEPKPRKLLRKRYRRLLEAFFAQACLGVEETRELRLDHVSFEGEARGEIYVPGFGESCGRTLTLSEESFLCLQELLKARQSLGLNGGPFSSLFLA